MTLGDYIKAYRSRHDLTMQEFAERSGMSKGYVSMLEKNKRPNGKPIVPSLEMYKKVADAIGMSLDELVRSIDEGERVVVNTDSQQQARPFRIPVYGTIPAGIPLEMVEDIDDWEEIPARLGTTEKDYFGLHVKGSSMYPKYLDGDTILARIQPDCESGQDCVVRINGDSATLKKVVKTDGVLILQPLNPEYSPLIFTGDASDPSLEILGVVIELRRKM